MKPLTKISLISSVANLVSFLLAFTGWGIPFIIVSLVLQFVTAIILTFNPTHRLLSQGMLIGLGISILIGFSVCTMVVLNGI